MRRTEREASTPDFMEQVLKDAPALYLALNNGDAAPYVFAVNHILLDGSLYFHCATEGRKLDLMRANPRVGFFAAADIHVEGTTTRYRSVSGTGTAEIIRDPGQKTAVLKALAAWYEAPCHFPISAEKLAITCIVRIRIESLSGKHSRRGEGPRPVPHYEN